jgi:GNAT superfamily N-acetyltransferase
MDDLRFGLRLMLQAGWNHLESDWLRFLKLGPQGCFIAELNGRRIGTTMTITFDKVAWIAMVLVVEDARGQGIGTALLKHALRYLDGCKIKTVRLDATHLGRPIYEKLGFIPEYKLVRFAGIAPSGRTEPAVTKAMPERFSDLIEFDSRITGTNRAKMLGALLREYPENTRVFIHGDTIEGFVTMRPGRKAIQIGPCTAILNAGPVLLLDALKRCMGKAVFVDVPTDNAPAVKFIEQSGLEIQRRFLRMYRGERVRDNITAIWSSSGPEKG